MVQEILQKCAVESNTVRLPEGQLDRKVYQEVAKKLELIGGKWKGGKVKGFVFDDDPTELLQAIANGEDRNIKKEYQFFPTPKNIARDMALMLQPIVKKKSKWLEPEAGDGALIKAVLDVFGGSFGPLTIDCFELMDLNRKKLEKLSGANILGDDFLTCDRLAYYDIIIANPPFTNNQDIDHIRKMYEVVKPGGAILTLSSPSWYTGSQRKQVEFKAWLEDMDVFPKTLPAKSFQESGTNIAPLLLMIKKKQQCRICGCTDEDCSKCIDKSGISCSWVEPDLCSQCWVEQSNANGSFLGDPRPLAKLLNENEDPFLTSDDGVAQECDATVSSPMEESEITIAPPVPVEEGALEDHAPVVGGLQESVLPTLPQPLDILNQMIENQGEINAGLQELKTIISPENTPDMNFFQKLFELMDGIDVTLRIQRVTGNLRIDVLPQAAGSIRPAVVAGSPEDLDAGFIDAIRMPIQKAKGLKLEMDEFHKSVVKAKEDALPSTSKIDQKPAPVSKDVVQPLKAKDVKKAPAKVKVVEPALFD